MPRGHPTPPTQNPTQADCIYAAGFFDGEGYIGFLSRPGRPSSLRVGVSQVKRRPLDLLRDCWGGSVRLRQPNSPHQQPIHTWVLSGLRAYRFLQQIIPWLLVKDQKAAEALDLWKGHKWRVVKAAVGVQNAVEV